MCIKVFKRRAGFAFRLTVSVYYFLLHYPTRDMQISYKQAFSYPNNFSYPYIFENRKVQRWLDNRGSTAFPFNSLVL